MSVMIRKIGSYFYKQVPALQPLIRSAYVRFFANLNFIGWGMATEHQVPWNDEYDWKDFRDTCAYVKQNFDLTPFAPSTPVNTDDLAWRHWVVSFAVRKSIRFTNTDSYNFVECGVGDGLTAFFALKEIERNGKLETATMYLYDSWQAMEMDSLVESEKSYEGKYKSLSLQRTQNNLKNFNNHVTYRVGYIPDTFEYAPPESIVYLHIDLNSSKPSLAALDFFLPKLVDQGIILFDDYGSFDHHATKSMVDKFLFDKPGVLEKLSTGQAIYYHRKKP